MIIARMIRPRIPASFALEVPVSEQIDIAVDLGVMGSEQLLFTNQPLGQPPAPGSSYAAFTKMKNS